jgi:hypothetical protein
LHFLNALKIASKMKKKSISPNIHHHSSFNNNLLMIQVHKTVFSAHGSLLMVHALAFAHLKPFNQRP